nr:hypothetical protein RSP597_25795 [Ralstonia solanacearum]
MERTVSLSMTPLVAEQDRIRLWDAIEQTAEPTTLTVAAGQTPQDAVKATCGSAYPDLMQKLYALNPDKARGQAAVQTTFRFIPCPYWRNTGPAGAAPPATALSVRVRKGEKLGPLVAQYMGTSDAQAIASVAKMNRKLVDADLGIVIDNGDIRLPFISKPATLTFDVQRTQLSTAGSVDAVIASLPPQARTNAKSALSPDRYQLVAVSEPTVDDPASQCGGPSAADQWPFDPKALKAAYDTTIALLPETPRLSGNDNVALIADTGAFLSDPVVGCGFR